MKGRIAVIGDIGGHVLSLRDDLTSLGVRIDHSTAWSHQPVGTDWRHIGLEWPKDLHVIQVGDLVHRGPDSLGVVCLAARLADMGVWTQVVGNHEQMYVDNPPFVWDEVIDSEAQGILRDMWADGRMKPSAGIAGSDGEDWLITHAGLTADYWTHGTDGATSVEKASSELDACREVGVLWSAGAMLGYPVNYAAGPVWAEAGGEVYASWIHRGEPMPFNQIHGHSSAREWWRDKSRAPRWVDPFLEIDRDKRHVTFRYGNRVIVGIDPCHGKSGARNHAPLVLEGEVAVAL